MALRSRRTPLTRKCAVQGGPGWTARVLAGIAQWGLTGTVNVDLEDLKVGLEGDWIYAGYALK